MTNDKTSHVVLWSGPIVVACVISLLLALLLPAVQQSREAARRTMSQNNLKQIGLALHNYESTFTVFPPGGVFSEEGTAFHGWTTSIAPYLDASPFYNQVNFDIPWDDPLQAEHFLNGRYPVFLNPSRQPIRSPDGFSLVHYSANQWLLHRNSSTEIKEIEAGTSNTLAMADAFGNFAPLGYPYIWRDPLIPMNNSPDGYGYAKTGMHVLLMDGTVRWINKDMASEIHKSFAGPEKLRPTAEQVKRPAGEYRLTVQPWKTKSVFDDPQSNIRLTVRMNSAGEPVSANMGERYDKGTRIPDRPFDEAIKGLEKYSDLLKFDGGKYFSDAGLKSLSPLPKLETVNIGGKRITDAGAAHLVDLPALKTLTLDQTEITAYGLAELLRAPHLADLTIIEPNFGDDGVEELMKFPSLDSLELTWHFRTVNVTPAKLVELLDQRPNLSLRVRALNRTYNGEEVRQLAGLQLEWGK